jgi:hypothetical protein
VSGGARPGGPGRGMSRGEPAPPGVVTLPSSREALATMGAATLSLGAGYGVLLVSELSAWFGWLLLAGGVALFGYGVRAGLDLQRHYEEGGRVSAGSRLLVWVLGALAGAGALGAVLLGGSVVADMLST